VLAKRKPVSHEDITADAAGPTEQPEPQPTGAAN